MTVVIKSYWMCNVTLKKTYKKAYPQQRKYQYQLILLLCQDINFSLGYFLSKCVHQAFAL